MLRARVVGAKSKIENKLAAKVGVDRLRNRRPCQRVYLIRNLLSRPTQKALEHAFVAAAGLHADRPADTTLFTQLAQHVILDVIQLRLHLTAAQQNNVMWSPNPSLYNLSGSCSQSQAPSTAAASTVAVIT